MEMIDIEAINKRLTHGLPLSMYECCWMWNQLVALNHESAAPLGKITVKRRCSVCGGLGQIEYGDMGQYGAYLEQCGECKGEGYQLVATP